MRHCYIILLIISTQVSAQLPRNDIDQYEYTQQIHLNAPDTLLMKRARNFFRQPFIVHWDSVAFVDRTHTGKGYIVVRINHRLSGFSVPIDMKLEIDVKENGYRYSIRHLEANKKNTKYVFPLEQKPQDVHAAVYEQLQQKTHRYIGFIISMLKRFMQGDL